MSRTRNLGDMITDVRQRVNMEESEFVTDGEITEWLNQELAELHARLTTNEGHPHFRTQYNINVVNGTSLYALPSQFWKLQRLVATLDGYTCDLQPFMEGERASLINATAYFAARGSAPMYRVQANNLEILPATRSYTATLFYTQRSPRLVDPTDTVDGFDGYEMAAINGACAIALQKEESDPSFYLMQKERILKHIDSMAHQRDASHPERVTDVLGDPAQIFDPYGYFR